MELVTLHYKFNESYRRGRESVKVVFGDFKYTTKITNKDAKNLTLVELKEKFKQDALEAAATETLIDYSDFISK